MRDANHPQTDHPAVRPLWASDEATVRAGLCPAHLAPAWQMLLLGDGSPTRHLGLLTGEPVRVDVVAMTALAGATDTSAPSDIQQLAAPLMRRAVWLMTSQTRLAHAVSWWRVEDVEAHLKDTSQPIWSSLADRRTELYRDVRGIALVESAVLQDAFERAGPFWSRHYLFWHHGRPLTVIRETFSPILERWLGPSRSAATLPSGCSACAARGAGA